MKTSQTKKIRHGFSLVEMTVTIAVLGIISAVAISSIGNIVGKSRDTVAGNVLESLNKATRKYSHSHGDLIYEAFSASQADELIVLRSLQYRAPSDSAGQYELNPKGPFMRPDWQPATSADSKDYRIIWTGSAWKLLKPGDSGGGLKLVFDGSDLGKPVVFPPGFELPVSR